MATNKQNVHPSGGAHLLKLLKYPSDSVFYFSVLRKYGKIFFKKEGSISNYVFMTAWLIQFSCHI